MEFLRGDTFCHAAHWHFLNDFKRLALAHALHNAARHDGASKRRMAQAEIIQPGIIPRYPMTTQDLLKQYEALKAENERLKQAQARKLSIKISEKGCVSVYGINARFPVSLYPSQWETLFGLKDSVEQFIATHREELEKLGEQSRMAKQAVAQSPAPVRAQFIGARR
jgi:hypothetical protein